MIMFIDDDEMALTLYSAAFKDYKKNMFSNPIAATRELLYSPEKYDIVITDLNMQPMTGYDVLKAARRSSIDVPFILITAYDELSGNDTKQKAEQIGFAGYFKKPVKIDDLKKKIKELHNYPAKR